MKLEIAYWNGAYSSLVEETNILAHDIDARFSVPAICNIVLKDADGSLAQKYRNTDIFSAAVQKDGAVYTTQTTEALNDTADDMDFWPAVNVVATADAYYFGFTEKAMRMIINVGIAAVYGSFVGMVVSLESGSTVRAAECWRTSRA
jgi:hypothetical protein